MLVYPKVEDRVSAEEAEHARTGARGGRGELDRLAKPDADDPVFDDELATLVGVDPVDSLTGL